MRRLHQVCVGWRAITRHKGTSKRCKQVQAGKAVNTSAACGSNKPLIAY